MSKAMSLKAKIRNIAKQKNIPAQVILQNYMFERLLVRLLSSLRKRDLTTSRGISAPLIRIVGALEQIASSIISTISFTRARS